MSVLAFAFAKVACLLASALSASFVTPIKSVKVSINLLNKSPTTFKPGTKLSTTFLTLSKLVINIVSAMTIAPIPVAINAAENALTPTDDVVADTPTTFNELLSKTLLAAYNLDIPVSLPMLVPILAKSEPKPLNWDLMSLKLNDVKFLNEFTAKSIVPAKVPTGPGNEPNAPKNSLDFKLVLSNSSLRSLNLPINKSCSAPGPAFCISFLSKRNCSVRVNTLSLVILTSLDCTSTTISIFLDIFL